MLAGRLVKGFFLFVLAAAGTSAMAVLTEEVFRETKPADTFVGRLGGSSTRECVVAGCNAQTESLIVLVIGFLFLGLWIYGMADAVRAVRSWNRAHGYTH
jgi:hypothetical protein